jgi:uncharacterized protein YneF (UPF0154 family)
MKALLLLVGVVVALFICEIFFSHYIPKSPHINKPRKKLKRHRAIIDVIPFIK